MSAASIGCNSHGLRKGLYWVACTHSAKKWHERLHKLTNAVHTEQKKRLDELKQHKKKEEAHGQKMLGLFVRPIFPFEMSFRVVHFPL